MYVCRYVCMYVSLTRICCTPIPEIRVCPEMLHLLLYINVVYVWFTTACIHRLNSKDEWSLDLLIAVCREDDQLRQVGECADTWYKLIQPNELLLPTCNLPTSFCESETTNGLTALLFCDIRINKGATLNLHVLQCLCVICICRAVQINNAETSLAQAAGYL